MDPLVELRGVTVRAGPVTILRDIDFVLHPGEVVGLFGANGAGKTTLLRVLATLQPLAEGSGTVLGADLRSPQRFEVRRRVGMIGHLPALYPELTLAENLAFAARVAGVDGGAAGRSLAAVGLAGAAGRRADACSHGMQRRAEFARELFLDRTLLLLDEPHSALDADAVDLVEGLFRRVAARGGAAVLVSHDRGRVSGLCDRTVELVGGTLR